jgi:hypothetical protein
MSIYFSRHLSLSLSLSLSLFTSARVAVNRRPRRRREVVPQSLGPKDCLDGRHDTHGHQDGDFDGPSGAEVFEAERRMIRRDLGLGGIRLPTSCVLLTVASDSTGEMHGWRCAKAVRLLYYRARQPGDAVTCRRPSDGTVSGNGHHSGHRGHGWRDRMM